MAIVEAGAANTFGSPGATGTAIATIGVGEVAVTTAAALTAYPGVTAVTAVTIGAEQ